MNCAVFLSDARNKADYFGQARHFLQILNFRYPEANDGKIQSESNLKNVLIQNPISYLNSNKFNSRICENVSEIGKLNIFSFWLTITNFAGSRKTLRNPGKIEIKKWIIRTFWVNVDSSILIRKIYSLTYT